jgi:hypothetical protein
MTRHTTHPVFRSPSSTTSQSPRTTTFWWRDPSNSTSGSSWAGEGAEGRACVVRAESHISSSHNHHQLISHSFCFTKPPIYSYLFSRCSVAACLVYDPAGKTRIHLIPRSHVAGGPAAAATAGGKGAAGVTTAASSGARIFETEAFFSFHSGNAFELSTAGNNGSGSSSSSSNGSGSGSGSSSSKGQPDAVVIDLVAWESIDFEKVRSSEVFQGRGREREALHHNRPALKLLQPRPRALPSSINSSKHHPPSSTMMCWTSRAATTSRAAASWTPRTTSEWRSDGGGCVCCGVGCDGAGAGVNCWCQADSAHSVTTHTQQPTKHQPNQSQPKQTLQQGRLPDPAGARDRRPRQRRGRRPPPRAPNPRVPQRPPGLARAPPRSRVLLRGRGGRRGVLGAAAVRLQGGSRESARAAVRGVRFWVCLSMPVSLEGWRGVRCLTRRSPASLLPHPPPHQKVSLSPYAGVSGPIDPERDVELDSW